MVLRWVRFARELRYNLIAPEARALCVNVVRVLASCKVAALSFTCTYPMVSAMTSYSSLTSRRIFVSRQHLTESDFEFHHWMTKVFTKSCLFIVCKTMFTIGESQAISLANRTANTRTPILGRSVGPGENARRKFPSIGGRAPDSHRTISKRLSECWLLIGHKKCFASLCPIGEQHLTTTNTKNMTFKRPYFYL